MNILKIDLDIKWKILATLELKKRLAYLHDIQVFNCNMIKNITLLKKSSYSARIVLKSQLKSEHIIIIYQLLMGSDWKKEANTLLNYSLFKMTYSNRLFSCKWYSKKKMIIAEKFDITTDVLDYVLNTERGKNHN